MKIARGELLRRRLQRLELTHDTDDEIQSRDVERNEHEKLEEAARKPYKEHAEEIDKHHDRVHKDPLPRDGQRADKAAHGAVYKAADDIDDAVSPPLPGAEPRRRACRSVSSATKPIQSAMSVTGIIHTQSGL